MCYVVGALTLCYSSSGSLLFVVVDHGLTYLGVCYVVTDHPAGVCSLRLQVKGDDLRQGLCLLLGRRRRDRPCEQVP